MDKAEIFLVRHGQTDDNVPPLRFQGQSDTALNQVGLRQAEALAHRVGALDLCVIYTSHLRRAVQTAAPVARRLGLEPVVDRRLAEGWRGEWEGLLMSDVERAHPDAFAAWRRPEIDFRFPGGESLKQHQRRSIEAMAEIAAGPKPALVVTHGGTIRCVILHLDGLDLTHFHELVVENTELVPLYKHAIETLAKSV